MVGDCMRIRYTIPFKRDLIIQDHWSFPIQGGIGRIVEKDGRAKAIEIVSNASR